jgi:hypothetical protein
MKRIFSSVLATAAALALPASANAAVTIYFGENTLPSGTVSGDPETARNAFLAALSAGVSTENFDGFADGVAPSSLTFSGSAGTIDATIAAGSGLVTGAPCCGRFATSGSSLFDVSDSFLITFNSPIAAFGFYGTDIGDFSGQVTITLLRSGQPDETLTVPNTINGPDGSLLFYGLIDSANPFTGLTFGNTSAGNDYFGFDDLTVGDVNQVAPAPAVPEPGSWALLILGFATTGSALRREKTKLRQRVRYA